MKVVITGRGTSGSFQIRGAQLGGAIGARVERNATKFADETIVLVKRCERSTLDAAHASRRPIIWDIVDAWPQPHGNSWGHDEALEWLERELRKRMKPDGVVAATRAMARDVHSIMGDDFPVLALPHHARPGLARNPIRDTIKTIGYEGGHQYLGRWQATLSVAAHRIGAKFVVNPAQLADLDVVIAVREVQGYPTRMWKSNVKLANAQGSGTPFMGNREAGYLETSTAGAEIWVESETDVAEALATMKSRNDRLARSGLMHDESISLANTAEKYHKWLSSFS